MITPRMVAARPGILPRMPDSPLSASASAPARPARPSATLVLVRDGQRGLEVLLLRRAERGDHNSGAWVFPGGLLDASDALAEQWVTGDDDRACSARMGLSEGGLAYVLAALRECFEECGLLFALHGDGRPVSGELAQQLAPWRGMLHRNERSLQAFAEQTGLRWNAGAPVYLSHWLTPLGRPKRFDTRFFIAEAPPDQVAAHDGTEMTAHRWLRPADVAAEGDALKLIGPTRATLQVLGDFESAAEAMAWARAPRTVSRIFPRLGTGSQGDRPVLPEEPSFVELGRLDPLGHGRASYEIVAHQPVVLSRRIVRVTAANPGVMTGPGTNSYLVGNGPGAPWAVIDPGPLDEAQAQALVDAAPGPIRHILVTHTHPDHSPGAAALKARTGALTYGRLPDHPDRQDAGFVPDRPLAGGERIVVGADTTLEVLHTPGHASNHLCYLLEEEKTLFTGDQVMQRSTVVINPPDGDMAAYLASLRELASISPQRIEWLAPGHGFLMERPEQVFEWIIAHRLAREAKVLDVLRSLGPSTVEQLVGKVYDDVPTRMHGVALRSLLAHLLKLRHDGVALDVGGIWRAPA